MPCRDDRASVARSRTVRMQAWFERRLTAWLLVLRTSAIQQEFSPAAQRHSSRSLRCKIPERPGNPDVLIPGSRRRRGPRYRGRIPRLRTTTGGATMITLGTFTKTGTAFQGLAHPPRFRGRHRHRPDRRRHICRRHVPRLCQWRPGRQRLAGARRTGPRLPARAPRRDRRRRFDHLPSGARPRRLPRAARPGLRACRVTVGLIQHARVTKCPLQLPADHSSPTPHPQATAHLPGVFAVLADEREREC